VLFAENVGRHDLSRRKPLGKHFLQSNQDLPAFGGIQISKMFDKSRLIDCPQLVKDHFPTLSSESAGDAGWISAPDRRHRRYDYGSDVSIHFIRRNDKAGSGLADLMASDGIKIDKINAEAANYHRHPVSSHFVGTWTVSESSNSSSCRARIFANASSQPARAT
jgi:hypothetical protein